MTQPDRSPCRQKARSGAETAIKTRPNNRMPVHVGLLVAALLLVGQSGAQAAAVIKRNTNSMLPTTNNWSAAPGAADTGVFTSAIAASNAVALALGGNLAIGGLVFSNNLSGPVTIAAGGTLTLNANAGNSLDLTTANQDVTIRCGIALGTNGAAWNVATGRVLVVGGVIANGAGGNGLVKDGAGTLVLGAANTFNNGTIIRAGTIVMSNGAAFASVIAPVGFNPGDSVVKWGIGITVDISSKLRIYDTKTTTVDLGGNNVTFASALPVAGTLRNGGLAKYGTGTLTLAGTNTYRGATTISGGKLVGVAGGSCTGSVVTVNAGKGNALGVRSADNTRSWTIAGLTFAPGVTALEFDFAGALSSNVPPLRVNGNVNFSEVAVNIKGPAVFAGRYPLMTWTGSQSGTVPDTATMPSASTGALSVSNATLYLTVSGPSLVVANVFASNMVLQRDVAVPIWGTANPGQTVTVTFAGQSRSATATANGSWRINLNPMPANADAQMLTVSSGGVDIVFTGVLVGDVWLCSGQSNMAYALAGHPMDAPAVSSANYPLIRYFTVANAASLTPVDDITVGRTWTACTSSSVSPLSAVAFYFAREIFTHTNVPLGLLWSSYGGTPSESWTSLQALTNMPELRAMVVQENLEYAQGTRSIQTTAATLFNAMIEPLIPYAMRGAIWYQGENNAGNVALCHQYRVLLPVMIADWRARWGLGDFPFYFQQLVNYGNNNWPHLREAQRMTLENTPRSGMAVGIDIGQVDNIHPTNKVDVGVRLAQWALARDYGRSVVASGPLCRDCAVEGSAIRVFFDYAETGLMVGQKVGTNAVQELVGGTLAAFEIAGTNASYVAASAVIDGATVLVSAPSVPRPVWARYGWTGNPPCNLYNHAGLPASPFRVTPDASVNTPMHMTGSAASLTIDAASNTTYWVDYKDNLGDPTWIPLLKPQTLNGAPVVVTNEAAALPYRFYRVTVAPY